MGLKCSVLGHSFEPGGIERDREEQGSEVVTVARELERCTRCGKERVVSENTEVTTVVDSDDVDLDDESSDATEGFGGVVDRSGPDEATPPAEVDDPSEDVATDQTPVDAADAVDELAAEPDDLQDRDPEEEDAEILTDDETDRQPGEWPEGDDEPTERAPKLDEIESDDEFDDEDEAIDADADAPTDSEEESLSGITVPEGSIVCESCNFGVDADSSYRDGDPCPECGSWLTTERNL